MTVFTVNETAFGWKEIAAAAKSWGDWKPLVEQARQSLACLNFAASSGQLPAAKDVRDSLTAFRYAHNLISADETQSWLNRWDVTIEELTAYLRGQLLIERWPDKLESIVAAHPVSESELDRGMRSYAMFYDKFAVWALKLAGHAAIAAQSGCFDAGGQALQMATRELVARVETEFEAVRKQTVTPTLIETKIADHRLDWIRFDCRCLWFAEERVAREAVWCVTEDGLTLEEVAADSRAEVRQWSFYLDEIDANVRPHFLAARQGDLLGPLKFREAFPLFSLAEKKMPVADDPLIQQRAETAIIAGLMAQPINERVKWLM